jgi:hypothetical protein
MKVGSALAFFYMEEKAGEYMVVMEGEGFVSFDSEHIARAVLSLLEAAYSAGIRDSERLP